MADAYRVIIQPEAYEGMESAYTYIEQESPTSAHRWATGLMDAINSMQTFPERCALAPENEFFPQELRQLLYRSGRGIYRVLFTVSGDAAVILHIRHGAQQTLKPQE